MGKENVTKAIALYEMMARRHAGSGHAPRQAQIYAAMAELMRDCETVQEAHEKIKHSKYYLAPGAALLQDKLDALLRASAENDMPDVATIYDEKIAKIDADVQAMYELGYERRAMNARIPYIETLEAFGTLYGHYLQLTCGNTADDTAMNSARNDLNGALSKLSKPDADFSALAQREKFRQLVPVTDEGYEKFVEGVIGGGADGSRVKERLDSEFAKTKAALRAEHKEIMETGRRSLANLRKSRVTVHAPDTKDGRYSYTDEEVKPFV